MNRLLRRKTFLFSLLVFVLLTAYQRFVPAPAPTGQQLLQDKPDVQGVRESGGEEGMVAKVVDGDTITVLLNGSKKKIRIIGINTPETVDPRRTVQCFGKEASAYAKSFLQGKTVQLEKDPTQDPQDKYGRLLRYVWVADVDFGMHMIEQGYAHEYTYNIPYKYQASYKVAEQTAQSQKKGLWADASCAGESQ